MYREGIAVCQECNEDEVKMWGEPRTHTATNGLKVGYLKTLRKPWEEGDTLLH